MAQQNRLGGYLLAIVSALAFGAMPVLAVGAYEGGAGVAMLLFWRFMLAALVLGPAALLLARRRAERPGARAIGTGLVMGGVLYAGQAALYFVSVQQGSAALAPCCCTPTPRWSHSVRRCWPDGVRPGRS